MKLTIFGTGYVGLVSGTCFAAIGHDVLCVDIDAAKVEKLRNGHVPIYEPGLEEILKKALDDSRLHFTDDASEAVLHSNMYFIAVGTPQAEDGSANLDYVFGLAQTLGRRITEQSIVVIKSTVPVGTSQEVESIISGELEKRQLSKSLVKVVSNPEFLKEGQAIADFMEPDRVVVGANDAEAGQLVAELYLPLKLSRGQMIIMDNKSAELTKYAANAMLATRISFMNQIANYAQAVGANIDYVKQGIATDTRIGPFFLSAGAGYGGSCFPKDVKALINACLSTGVSEPTLLQAVHEINENQKTLLVSELNKKIPDLRDTKIGIWGLAFKPDTDDVREATSLKVVGQLLKLGAKVIAYDPIAIESFSREVTGSSISYASTAQDLLGEIDALLILTEWNEFKEFDLALLKQRMIGKYIFDGRNIFQPKDFENSKIEYFSIGRPS